MLKSLIESFIDAVCNCFGVARFKPVPRLTREANEFYLFLKEQQESARRAKYFACC
jgi:hypothetical protein